MLLVLVLLSSPAFSQHPVMLADPTIFHHKGMYYLYGTGSPSNDGFVVHRSEDLVNWSGPVGARGGFALKKGDAFGNGGFWAPQVLEHQGKFYMAYTADEQIAIAVSDDPLGPFRQVSKKPLSGVGKQIDPFLFRDSDGVWYLYHVRLTRGNRIFVAKMKADLGDVDTSTAREVLAAEEPWENTKKAEWPVAEGPTVIKRGSNYFLFYSANDFRNPDYAVGYAVSDHPMGPWKKQGKEPIISRKQLGVNGTGHGDLLRMPGGEYKYVMHTHYDSVGVAPRRTAVVDIRFRGNGAIEKPELVIPSFRFFQSAVKTFRNPLLPSGADPFSYWKDGYYYYTNTQGNRLSIWKTRNLSDLHQARAVTVYTPPANTAYSKELWAPELHYIGNKWYLYFAADDGRNDNHRMYVLENAAADPTTGDWIFKGKVADPSDKWAIDGNVFEWKGQLYMIWSGWEGDTNGQQNIYLAKMDNPWTISGNRVCISKPLYEWEKHGTLNDPVNPPHVSVNEGPQSLIHKNRLFIVFSASGCWTDNYALGLLRFRGGENLLDPASWVKDKEPVFSSSPENGIYAPGHNSFFKSPDGKEDWILFHANDKPGQGCGGFRSPRAQKFSWKSDGSPDFGQPLKTGIHLVAPAE